MTPTATYRLQFHDDFTLADAGAILPYLQALGVSHVYASPLLAARPGSPHGYDITDHGRISDALGGIEALRALVAGLRARGMGLLLDIVPNHMGVGGADNALWLDVLEWGKASPHADWFDIDWEPADVRLSGRVLAPFLGASYGEVLASGDLVLRADAAEGSLSFWYHEHRFPLAARDYHAVLPDRAERGCRAGCGDLRLAASGARAAQPAPAARGGRQARPGRGDAKDRRRPSSLPRWHASMRRAITAPRSMGCSNGRTTGCAGGARRPMRSTTGASSTSTASPASASRCPAPSMRRMA